MNAIEYRESRTDALIAVLGSFLVHTLLFLLLISWLTVASVFIINEVQNAQEEKEDKVISLNPEYFTREEEAPLIEEKKKFAETNPAIPEAQVKEAPLIGEKSTLAASETVLDEGDPTLPTQFTREDLAEDLPNTFNSDFVDAEIDALAAPESKESEVEIAPPITQSTAISDATEEGNQEVEALPKSTAAPPQADLVQTPTQVNVQEEKKEDIKEPVEEEAEPTVEKLLGEKKAEKGLPKPVERAQKAQAGFQTQQRKTRIIGSLSRDGASSLEVQKTALGQYYSQVSKIIERQWQGKCIKYRELIHPGVISMQFYISTSGKVSGVRPYDVVSASEVQKGFTMQAIRESDLPPMPSAAKQELGQEKLELIYNFYF